MPACGEYGWMRQAQYARYYATAVRVNRVLGHTKRSFDFQPRNCLIIPYLLELVHMSTPAAKGWANLEGWLAFEYCHTHGRM